MDPRSPTAAQYRKLYATAAWKGARVAQLSRQPLCERCHKAGRITPATVVNHRTPHKGSWSLFIDPRNHESVCKPCHDGAIQSEERTGQVRGVDESGRPLDPSHPWHRAAH